MKKYTLDELNKAVLANFEGYEEVRKDCLDCDKYGNDLDTADSMANELYEYVAKGVRNRGIEAGMQYFLIVLSNNQLNTEWGNQTAASPDGRLSEMYMNPANNPQGGADKSYGIQVAKLAGVPDSVIQRAKELVEELSDADITAAVKDLTAPKKKQKITYDQLDMAQMSLFDTVQDNDIIEEIKNLEIGNLTPMEALNILYNLQNKIKNRW